MSEFGIKLSSILTDKGFDESQASSFATALEAVKSGYAFPNSFALKLQIDPNLSRTFFAILYTEGILNHYSIPKFREHIFWEAAQIGFALKFENLQDPEDFTEISSSEIEVITGYKLVVHEPR